jgi:PEP-CTERM motif
LIVRRRTGIECSADGNVVDVVNAPGVTADAMRIDGTVTAGVNNNLLAESGAVDEVLSPGETWRSVVTNVIFPASYPPVMQFDSVGGFSGSSAGHPPSTFSILAKQRPIPEPSTAALFGLGLVGLVLRRRSD